jgi:HTH-type transcriptional regulator, sugar sensing transcriptional regulator
MLEKNLQDLGLNEKEAKVYLAALELGQATVQQIAEKSVVNRATTYFIIESLMAAGLMSSFHQGKKQFFMASDPERLLEIISEQQRDLSKREATLKQLLPELKLYNNKLKNKPVVRYYEGKEGIKAMVRELTIPSKEVLRMAFSKDAVDTALSAEELAKMRKGRVNVKNTVKAIYTYENGVLERSSNGDERRKVPFEKFPIRSDIAIYDKFIRLASFSGRMVGIVIEDEELAGSMRALLDLAWEAAEKYDE